MPHSSASGTGSLGSRLGRIRGSKNHKEKIRKTGCIDEKLLPGWTKINAFVYFRKDISESPFSETKIIKEGFPFFKGSLDFSIEQLLFYDLETTGLSGGAGTLAFLAGFGWVENNRLIVNQYFLSDFPGEVDLLVILKELLAENKILVSYNGKSFDHPLLKTRFLLKGMQMPVLSEIDLLHISRRLWKNRLPSCRLGVIENNILDIHRVGDIPGIDIPDVYFNFLKNSQTDKLQDVFKHHLQDIKSLAFLFSHIERLWNKPEHCQDEDKTSLGKLLLLKKRTEGLTLLRTSWEDGDYDAGKFLSLYLKRAGSIVEAVAVWEEMWKKRQDIFQGIELAKYYEHKVKDIPRALKIVTTLMEKDIYLLSKKGFDKLDYRKKRLKRKLLKGS
ncbi:MAG: ribonuclease H-like domain-containing protein [Spirochaetaceae bacterium]|nr:ribonuclease H-like domain-containing protein [Spirochaetaceae bacterium]